MENIDRKNNTNYDNNFAFGTKIRLFTGSEKVVEKIKLDDKVIGVDGKPKKVIKMQKNEGLLYKITQKNGINYIVSSNHKLVLIFTNVEGIFWNNKQKYYKARYIQNYKIHDKCFSHDKSTEFTEDKKITLHKNAKEFLTNKAMEDGYKRKGDIIEISVDDYLKLPTNIKKTLYGFKKSIDFIKKTIDLDPYFLGVWLGDGTTTNLK